MRARELLEEAPCGGVVPLVLEVGHPPAPEEEERAVADRRVRDPPPVQLAEPDLLLHDP